MTEPPSTDQRRPLSGGALGLALTLAALWGGNPVAAKAGLENAPPLRLSWMRFVLGTIVILVWAIATKQSFQVLRSE